MPIIEHCLPTLVSFSINCHFCFGEVCRADENPGKKARRHGFVRIVEIGNKALQAGA